jgi:hypothetical protein
MNYNTFHNASKINNMFRSPLTLDITYMCSKRLKRFNIVITCLSCYKLDVSRMTFYKRLKLMNPIFVYFN